MANKKDSAAKRHRQSEERRIRNKSVKTSIKTAVRKFITFIQKKEQDNAEQALREMAKKIDTAARKGIIKKNAAARKKSRMQKRFNLLKPAQ
ncbi:MAG: 30S ribosomal protein S20 [Spirochaetaceae bacterium]|nr:30S ribosomal protein S20 [Spirochaetaceae bacterium]